MGLKENVIIGKLIPAGTGVVPPKSVEIDIKEEIQDDLEGSNELYNESIAY